MKSYTLSISPDYVKSWGVWEAIRELLQNAFDQRDLDPNCVVTFSHNPLEETVTIGTSTGRLSPQSLLLGISSKSKDRALRGQFGEGYKLAMLVLVRSGHDVRLYNGPELWLPRIKFSESYGCDVLTIEAANIGGPADGVKFMVTGISTEEWMAISQKVNPNQTSDTILDENKGDVFVGGLYVTTLPELHKGYAFSPKSLTLDRDRGMVSNFDVRYATSKLWTHREKVDPDSVYKMLETDAPDVQYVDCHASSTSTITKSAYAFYTSKYGNAVPVATQEEVQKAQAAGVEWRLIPSGLRKLLWKIKQWVLPNCKSPAERLRDVIREYEFSLSQELKVELLDIADKIDFHNEAPTTEAKKYTLEVA